MELSVKKIIKTNIKRLIAILLILGVVSASIPYYEFSLPVYAEMNSETSISDGDFDALDQEDEVIIASDTDNSEKTESIKKPDVITETDIISETDNITDEKPISESDIIEIVTSSDIDIIENVTESDIDTVTASDIEVISVSDLFVSLNGLDMLTAESTDIASGTAGACSWRIDEDGTLIISPTNGTSGVLVKIGSKFGWENYFADIKGIIVEDGVIAAADASNLFSGMTSCTSIDLSGLNTSNVTNMSGMFQNCTKITKLNLSGFNTGKVTNFSSMFDGCENIDSLDLSNFNTSNGTNFKAMFQGCTNLSWLDISSFDTSKVSSNGLNNIFNNVPNIVEYKVSTKWTPDSSYSLGGVKNSFNVKDGNLQYLAGASGYSVYFVTVHDHDTGKDIKVNLSTYPVTYTKFTGNKTATIRFAKTFKVYFYDNTVSPSLISTQTIMSGDDAEDPYKDASKIPYKEGFYFAGWNRPITKLTKSVSIYAQYKPVEFSVRFNANGAEGAMKDQNFVYGTSQNLAENGFTREGYSFLGWNTNKDATAVLYTDKQAVKNLTNTHNEVIDLYAIWKINQYTIDFDSNGGNEVADITQDYNTAVTAPADPTREGYTFTGWDTEIPEFIPARDMKITATWKINQYTIDFDSNGGSEVADITQDYNTAVTAPADPVREGYTFTGWDTEIPEFIPAKDMKITATWKINQYTIDFDSNGGSEVADITQDYNTAVTAPADPVREGYTFTGWDTEIPEFIPARDMKITATWKINQYTIDFDSNGGSEVADITQDYNTAVTAPADPVREGYTFTGWDTEIPEFIPARDMKITATWKINQYTIDFDSNGGSEVADITQDYNTAVTAPADPVREGYTFTGWDTEIPEFIPARDMKITATWKINQYTIDFDTNGGSEVADITQDYNTAVTAPADPTREGYTFTGWDTEIPAFIPAKDMKITATWIPNTYIISFDSNGGEGYMPDLEMTYDTEKSLTPNSFTKKNHEFIGWSTDAAGTMAEYIDCQKVINIADGETVTEVTLYAIWSKNAMTVTASAGEGGSITPLEANVPLGGSIDFTITPDNMRYEISEVTVNGKSIKLSELTDSGDSKVLSLTNVTEDTSVEVKFTSRPMTGTPKITFGNSNKTFDVNELIEFKVSGYWPDTEILLAGDECYVPERWHHSEPSGDWNGVDDPAFDYSASFTQSKAGKYVLKVEVRKYVYDGTAWTDSGIVTVEGKYTVKAESSGSSIIPETGDNGTGVAVIVLMLVSLTVMIVCVFAKRRKKNEA